MEKTKGKRTGVALPETRGISQVLFVNKEGRHGDRHVASSHKEKEPGPGALKKVLSEGYIDAAPVLNCHVPGVCKAGRATQ